MNNSRLLAVIFFILIALVALVIRLVNVQLVKSEELQFYAQRQQTRIEKILPERGMIYDRNLNLLVYNRNDVSFYVDLRMASKKNKDSIAAKFSRAFGKSFSHYASLLDSKEKMVCIEKKVSGENVHELKKLKINGLAFQDEPTRIYQYNNLASHILGYVNTTYSGTEGIEKTYDNLLHGEEGRRLVIRDAHGKIVTIDETYQKPAIKGKNVILTIDKNIQSNLENELRLGKEKFGATGLSGIVMDPNTGEILAMASIDDFDPNNYSNFSDSVRRNKIVTDVFEPGSTFKAIALASILDKKLCDLNESIFLENGVYHFKRIKIQDSHKSGFSTVRGVFSNSSNIGMSKLSQRIENEDFYLYLRSFGLGNLTNIDLPSEVKGNLKKPNTWTDYTKSSISFGYEISLTAIQLVSMYAALINGGILYQPMLIKSLENSENGTIEESEPIEIRRVITEETSNKMKGLFREVVESGTGKKAIIEGISVGGKTGTSRQIIDGAYSREKYNSSFIGFFPVENPKYLILVVANSPTLNSYYGGDVAAPIFKSVAEKIIIDDEVLFKEKMSKTKNSNLQFSNVKDKIDSLNKNLEIKHIKTRKDFARLNLKKMPDLKGLTIREAIYLMTKLKIKYQITGNGRIDTQSIPPGTKINSKLICKISCSSPQLYGARLY